ncbi:MAG: FliH/SctL family protein, partial [Desulfovermiculus sp.]
MSRILRANISSLERIQFRDLDSISDTSDSVFEVVSWEPATKTEEDHVRTAEIDKAERENAPGRANEKNKAKDKGKLSEEESAQEAAVDVEALRTEAYAQGLADGQKKMRLELDKALQAFSQAAKELDGMRNNFIHRQSDDLIHLSIGVAEQVIAAELSLKPDVIVSVVSKAMESAFEADEYRIRVNPEDVSVVQENRPLLLANVNGLRQIYVQSDENITRGGCVVESNKGQ